MEQEKTKKSKFDIFVIILNIIAIIFMVVTIGNVGIVEECTENIGNPIMIQQFNQQFNQKFTTYEGIRTGSQIKQLIATINTSNVDNIGTDFLVEIIDNTGSSTKTIDGDSINGYRFKGGSAKKYKVQIIKNDNWVKEVIIYDNTEEINEYVVNNNTYETEKENETKYTINWDIIFIYIIILILYIAVFIFYKLNKKRILKKYANEECEKRLIEANKSKTTVLFIISVIIIIYSYSNIIMNELGTVGVHKPIIYIYPEEETEVTVELGRKENLTCTYPVYEDKWEVTAKPDGTLKDEETGRTYYALYWEGINIKKYGNKLEEGFVVKGEDTIKFLEEKLEILGLNEKEAEEFIVYWLPKMQNNKYNYIRFQTMEEINKNMPIEVTPTPETLIRVMMEWKELNRFIEVKEQQLEKVERKGYTVIEWGGTEIK